MAQNKLNKLELTWIGKYDEDKQPLEPRILIENPEYSYGEVETGVLPNGKPWNGNMLIHGDNLLALKSLEQDYAGCVKCIYIDPPYNTGNAFEHYDDGIEHSIWLSLMRERLLLLRNLLADDGSIWVQLDDNEVHYCKVLMDEIFGRNNFMTSIVWKRRAAQANLAKNFSPIHDFILVYARNTSKVIINKVPLREEYIKTTYRNPDNDPRGIWRTKPLLQGRKSKNPRWTLELPDGRKLTEPWRCTPETYQKYLEDNRIYIPEGGVPNIKIFLSESEGQTSNTFWDGFGTNEEAAIEIGELFGDKTAFDTPKPEALIKQIFTIGSSDGDLVLDSFLGSGTTAAVAHKMGRRWIGVELGDHAYTHCAVRMQKVVDGNDQGGISKAQNWKGGGGFRFYELAPSLLKEDRFGNLVINKEYNADMLAAAMAKQEGFTYSPSADIYWKQGFSSESDYIYTTTQFMTVEGLAAIAEQMKEGESLLVCCTAFQKECRNAFANITIKKIPQMLLGRCQFDKDDYSLNIVELPIVETEEIEEEQEESIEEVAAAPAEETQQELF
ncbi:MAG: site-specific DNA-methyltransferase [Alistipes sp.]|nr:site-specific DNA-methyltransferase [Alistipes sp.]